MTSAKSVDTGLLSAYANSRYRKSKQYSDLISNAKYYARADYDNEWNAAQVQKQMDFQERMSNTAHQREVKDLISAGLNPILSANGGASAPSGASASADTSASDAVLQKDMQKAQLANQIALQQMQIGAQLEMNKANIASAQKMAKWTIDLNRELGYAQLENQKAVANISAGASMYNANLSASASRYATDTGAITSKYATDIGSSTQTGNVKVGPVSFNTGLLKKAGKYIKSLFSGYDFTAKKTHKR